MTRAWSRVIVLVAAVLVAALTARLGVWQLDRAARKIALQDSITERGRLPPLETADLAREPQAAALQYDRRIRLTGQWIAAHTVYLENRQMEGRTGFYVVTPLQLQDGTAVLVQRGWQPRDQLDRTRVAEVPSPPGPITLLARIAPPPARLYEFDAAAQGRIRQNLDPGSFSMETGLALRPLSVMQLDAPDVAADGLKRDWPQPAVDVQKHYGYAFQWFAMSALAACLYVWFQIFRPWRQRRRT